MINFGSNPEVFHCSLQKKIAALLTERKCIGTDQFSTARKLIGFYFRNSESLIQSRNLQFGYFNNARVTGN